MSGITLAEISQLAPMENGCLRCSDCGESLHRGYGRVGSGFGVYEYCRRCLTIVNNWQDYEVVPRATCVYVEMLVGYENAIQEFPCKNIAVHGLFCEEHKCFDNDPAADMAKPVDATDLKSVD